MKWCIIIRMQERPPRQNIQPPERVNLDPKMTDFSRHYPHLEDVFNGCKIQHADHITGAEVTDCSHLDGPCIVGTAGAGIVRENQQIMTEGLKGCVAVYIELPRYKALAHFTPSSSLGYRHGDIESVKVAIDKLVSPLRSKGSLEHAKAVIITNIAGENRNPKVNFWHHQRVKEDWQRLQSILGEYGIIAKIVEVPLDHSAVLSIPEKPGQLYVLGNKAHIDQTSGREIIENSLANVWISTDPSIQETFIEHSPYVETQKEERSESEVKLQNRPRRLLEL